MRRRRLILALLLVLAGCQAGGDGADAPSEPVAVSEPSAGGATYGELRGYDRDGPVSCPPLPTGRRCLATEAAAAARAACTAKGGRSMACEDCSVICSRSF